MNIVSKTPKIELILQPHELLHLDNKEHPVAISCKNGLIWVTCEGEIRDRFLRAGRSYIPKTRGRDCDRSHRRVVRKS